jgi:hypothetical protein
MSSDDDEKEAILSFFNFIQSAKALSPSCSAREAKSTSVTPLLLLLFASLRSQFE